LGQRVSHLQRAIGAWQGMPYMLTLTGIILAVAIIHFFMRQVFNFDDLLLARDLPERPAWVRSLLLAPNEGIRSLYFSGLIAGIALTGELFFTMRSRMNHTRVARLLTGILAFLVTTQLLLLPVNHGVLISVSKSVPRVMSLDGEKDLEKGQGNRSRG
jgi:hypothetical protein